MQDSQMNLIRAILDGDRKESIIKYIKTLLNEDKTQKSRHFVKTSLQKIEKIESKKLIELPYNLKGKLTAESNDTFPKERYLITPAIEEITETIIKIYNVQEKLRNYNINYFPTMLLYGDSGCGKTMIAKYIAYKTGLPYYYMNFSQIIDSLMGKTANNLSIIFEFVKENPGVLCIDEIDAIGTSRQAASSSSQAESNRITITMMQEIQKYIPGTIVIATTNREDCIDKALSRRFSKKYEIKAFTFEEAVKSTMKFFEETEILVMEGTDEEWQKQLCIEWLEEKLSQIYSKQSIKESKDNALPLVPASVINDFCVERLINILTRKNNNEQ